MIIEKTPEYSVEFDGRLKKMSSSNANYVFDTKTGFTVSWGKTVEEDPGVFPAPEILDIEVTTKCTGPGGKSCAFCTPEGTLITLEDGTTKEIQDIKVGDKVKAYKGGYHKVWRSNEVIETYERDYEGDLICIELESGEYIELTPNHPVLTMRGWVEAGDLNSDDDIITFKRSTYANMIYTCDNCGSFFTRENRVEDKQEKDYKGYRNRTFCSTDCLENFNSNRTKICKACGKEFRATKQNDLFCKDCYSHMYFPRANKHHLWNLYSSMIQRCFNPKNGSYKFYGAKGKIPDKRWMSFENFLEDMEKTWFPGASLDRINNNLGYSKENCRWVSIDEQRTNRGRFKNSSKEYKHICKLPGGSYFVGGPKINGDPGSKAFKTLEEALEYRNNRYKEKYPNSYEMYIKE